MLPAPHTLYYSNLAEFCICARSCISCQRTQLAQLLYHGMHRHRAIPTSSFAHKLSCPAVSLHCTGLLSRLSEVKPTAVCRSDLESAVRMLVSES